MKKDITIRAALALSLALVLVLAGCGGNSDSSARIVVQGTAANTVARDIAGGGGTFSSGEVFVNSERITDLLEPSAESAGQGGTGDTLFEATVDNVPHTVTLRVDPRPGFVFDEWKLNKNKLRGLQWHEYLDLLLTEEESHAENLTVKAEHAEYYIATFERGFYIDLEAADNPDADGTKDNPYTGFDEAIGNLPSNRYFDDDIELTFKVAGSKKAETLSIASMASVRGGEIEELRIIGGYDRNWNKTGRSEFSISFTGFTRSNIDEFEIKSVHLPSLEYRDDLLYNDDIEFHDVYVDELTVSSGTVANLMIGNVNRSGSGRLVFVNSVLDEYVNGAVYIHSLIKGGVSSPLGSDSLNNIVLADGIVGNDTWNLYLPASASVNDYMLSDPPSSVINASSLGDDGPIEDIIDDDFLEEDIVGRERADDWGRRVSYGPYEYLDLERWERDWWDD